MRTGNNQKEQFNINTKVNNISNTTKASTSKKKNGLDGPK